LAPQLLAGLSEHLKQLLCGPAAQLALLYLADLLQPLTDVGEDGLTAVTRILLHLHEIEGTDKLHEELGLAVTYGEGHLSRAHKVREKGWQTAGMGMAGKAP